MTYLSPTPVRDLENWFLGKLKLALPSDVYLVLGPEDNSALVPESHVRIEYTGYSSSAGTTSIRQSFNFRLTFRSAGPSDLNPHHDALTLMEAARFALWEQLPPRPATASYLILQSEKSLAPETGCGCKPGYEQNWSASGIASNEIRPSFDPCVDEGEPDAVIPQPLDFITPFNEDWYYCLNPEYDSNLPLTIGENEPWNFNDIATEKPVANPLFNPDKPPKWGNRPVIICPYFKKLNLIIKPRND
jgi:hypothetical protein